MLDVVVDGYFDTIDRFERYYDDAADQVFGESPIEPAKHRHWFEMRKSLNQFDRIVGPLAEALATIVDRRPRRASRTPPRRTSATSPASSAGRRPRSTRCASSSTTSSTPTSCCATTARTWS